MQFRAGYELVYNFLQPTPIILVVNIHDSRAPDLVVTDRLTVEPPVAVHGYRDIFGNQCHRVLAPAGRNAQFAGRFRHALTRCRALRLQYRRQE